MSIVDRLNFLLRHLPRTKLHLHTHKLRSPYTHYMYTTFAQNKFGVSFFCFFCDKIFTSFSLSRRLIFFFFSERIYRENKLSRCCMEAGFHAKCMFCVTMWYSCICYSQCCWCWCCESGWQCVRVC